MKVTLKFGDHYDAVLVNGLPLTPDRSLQVVNHSPTGFAWGYQGSAPAQLALALLLVNGVHEDVAVWLHQDFKREFVATWPQTDFEVEVDPAGWAVNHPRLMDDDTRKVAAQAVCNAIAHSVNDRYWTLANTFGYRDFPEDVLAHDATVGGHTFYPMGVLALHALGRPVPAPERGDD